MTLNDTLSEGARNLLVDCAGISKGQSLLIICEDPATGWYDADVSQAVAAEAHNLGVVPEILQVGPPENDRNPGVTKAINDHDCTVFFARLGDQGRFAEPTPGKTSVMCYARDADMLASAYGRASFSAFRDMKNAINDVLLNAGRIDVTCPLGSSLSGTVPESARAHAVDVTLLRFPMGVPVPMVADEFSGQVALAHYLTTTGSKVYDPTFLTLEKTLFCRGRKRAHYRFQW